MRHQDFSRFLASFGDLSPAQMEGAQVALMALRQQTAAISAIEARTTNDQACPFCDGIDRQRWGRTRTNIQRYRCKGCLKIYTGRTGSVIVRLPVAVDYIRPYSLCLRIPPICLSSRQYNGR